MMEQDKHLKEIFVNSAESATADFTEAVMQKVYRLSAASCYKPLVHPRLRKGFVFAFGAIVIAILSLCLAIALGDLNIGDWMQIIRVPDINYNKLLVFIFIFWTLFALNMQFQKNFLFDRNKGVNHHQ